MDRDLSPLEFEVRPGAVGDADGMASVWLTGHGGQRADATRLIAGELGMAARGEGRVVYVAVHDKRIVAYSRARRWTAPEVVGHRSCPAGWWLSGTLVLPEHRRRGIATALMRARLGVLPAPVHSRVDVANDASCAWHMANGFEEVTRDFTAPRTRNPDALMILFRWSGAPPPT